MRRQPKNVTDQDFLAEAYQRYKTELNNSVIPFWLNHSPDRDDGAYFTCLDQNGNFYDTEKYLWMQWRIVYMFATLYKDYRQDPEWLAVAEHGYDFLIKHGKSSHGDYYFSLNKKGVASTAPYEPFANCFATAGCAALYHITGKTQHRQEAELAMDCYLKRIKNPKGQWEKALSGRKSYMSFGPYMILANLGQIMNKCLNTNKYDADIKKAITAVTNIFWQEEHGVIFENMSADGKADLDSSLGRHIIPGHGLEACWFILEYAEKTQNKDLIKRICPMILKTLEFSWDSTYGGIYYFMDILNKPHMELQANMKLWWVHNEAILATLYAYKLSGDKQFLDWFKKIDQWTWKNFPDNKHGEWFGYLDRRGVPTHKLKGGKWKTFFHLPRFLYLGQTQIEEILKLKIF